jgi:hypothetical protein
LYSAIGFSGLQGAGLKEAFDPNLGDGLALPPDPELKQELCAGR